MIEGRNIVQEFKESRSHCSSRGYIFVGDNDIESHKLLQQTLRRYGFDVPSANHQFIQKKVIVPGVTDKMLTSFDVGYKIASLESGEGIHLIPDRLIVPWENREEVLYWLDYYRNIKSGNIEFSSFKAGEYGAVGFNPRIKDQPGRTDICVKFYNFAYPYSQADWEENIKQKGKVPPDTKIWKLSGVTGIGSFVAHRYLINAGIPMPTPHFATSEIFVQDFIDGYTICDLIDDYEKSLKNHVNPVKNKN